MEGVVVVVVVVVAVITNQNTQIRCIDVWSVNSTHLLVYVKM